MECPTVCGSSSYGEVLVEVTAQDISFLYYVVLVIYGVTIIVCLLVNVVVLTVLVKKFKKFMETTFFVFLFHLIIANLLMIFYQLVVGMPVVFIQNQRVLKDYIGTVVFTVFRHVDVLIDHVTSLITVVIAFHRMMIFVSKDFNHRLFSGKGLVIWQTAIWCAGVILTAFLGYVNCVFAYVLNAYGPKEEKYTFVCDEPLFTYPVFYGLLSKSILLPTICLVFYLVIVGKLYMLYKKSGSKYGDVPILSQAIITYVAFQIDLIAGALTPMFVIYTSKDVRKPLEKYFIRSNTTPVMNYDTTDNGGRHREQAMARRK